MTLLYVPSLDKVCNMYICITLIKQGYVLNICYNIVYSDSSVGWIGLVGGIALINGLNCFRKPGDIQEKLLLKTPSRYKSINTPV